MKSKIIFPIFLSFLILLSMLNFQIVEAETYIFEDGFESGDFSEWTGTKTLNGNIEVDSTHVYQGSYAAHANVTQTAGWEKASCYKDITAKATVFARAYFYITTMPINTHYLTLIKLSNTSTGFSNSFRVKPDGYLEIYYRDNGGYQTDTSATQLNVNMWYCIEVKTVISSSEGEVRVYLDGSEVTDLTHTGLNNSDTGNVNRIYFGIDPAYDTPGELWFDCVVVDDEYIGPLSSNNAPTIGQFQAPSTVYANKMFRLNTTINDVDGVADFKNCTVELSNNIILLWVNSTNNFTEYADPLNYITVDGGTRTQLNTTAYRLSWQLTFSTEYPVGQVDVIGNNTKVYDSSGLSNSTSYSNLFYFAGEEPSGGPTGGPTPSPPPSEPPSPPPEEPPSPPPVAPLTPPNMVVLGIIILFSVVLFATVSGEEKPKLSVSRKKWRTNKTKKKVKWKKKKAWE